MAERVVESQQTHFDLSRVTVHKYESGWDSLQKDFRRELASAVSGPVVLTNHLMKLLATL